MTLRFVYICIIGILLFSCHKSNSHTSRWHLIYKNAHDGKALFGDKKALIDAVRMGSPVRVGFGGRRLTDTTKSMEHIVDAGLVSITNDEDLFVQTSQMIGQTPDLDRDTVTMELKNTNTFSWIIGTNGTMSSLSIDFKIDSLHTPSSSFRGLYWYIYAPISDHDYSALKEDYPEGLWNNPRRRK